MKVYKIKEGVEETYVCSNDETEAQSIYEGELRTEQSSIDEISELPKDEWSTVTIVYTDEEEPDTTIENVMQGKDSAEVLCSTFWE